MKGAKRGLYSGMRSKVAGETKTVVGVGKIRREGTKRERIGSK